MSHNLPLLLSPLQDIERKILGVYHCVGCSGEECEKCSGVGLLKSCRSMDCKEYGCCGGGECLVSQKDIEQIINSNLE